ncbi:MAG: methyltransferase domain-containing protein [Hyphomicrobium sp.]
MSSPPEFDKFASKYSSDIEKSLAVFGQSHDYYTQRKAEVLNAMFGAGGLDAGAARVLDVGCGVGLVHPYLTAGMLHGVDVSEESLAVARGANPGVDYRHYDGGKLPYASGSFDFAFAICVLHHVPTEFWPSFAAEMARVVKPNGKVIVIEHNPLNPATQWVVNTCPLDENAVLLTQWKLKRLMRAAGLVDLKVQHILFTPFSGALFRSVDRLFAKVPLGAQYVFTGTVAT